METQGRVLIVDDQVGDLAWLIDYIQSLGHDIVVATNERAARQCLEAVKDGREAYILAIIDVMAATHSLMDLAPLNLGDSRDTGIRLCRYARQELGLSAEQLPMVCLTIRNDEAVRTAMKELDIPLFDRDNHGVGDSIRSFVRDHLGDRRSEG